uniref:Leprecan-like alpha-helical domain-containing protein n=1 Tax=Oncorhynchus tshawytscha TaxID=74940 RepID=A0AAZ3QAH4_ONCTS
SWFNRMGAGAVAHSRCVDVETEGPVVRAADQIDCITTARPPQDHQTQMHYCRRYTGEKWQETVDYLEVSLRLYRLLGDSEAFCQFNCSSVQMENEDEFTDFPELRMIGNLCKQRLPAFRQTMPSRDTVEAFEKREPYKYLQFAYFKVNEIKWTSLHIHRQTHWLQVIYKSLLGKAPPYLSSLMLFVRAVRAYNGDNYRRSLSDMELALRGFFKVYEECLAASEGAREVRDVKYFYPSISVNDLKNAVLCVANCMLFDPSDEVMKNNVVYNQYHRDKYELGDKDFRPRSDAVQFFNQTTMQLQMLEFSRQRLASDEVCVCLFERESVSLLSLLLVLSTTSVRQGSLCNISVN